MNKTIITEVCKAADLQKGDTFYTYWKGQKIKWTVMQESTESDYGVAIGNHDNMYFHKGDIFIVKELY